MHELVEGKNEVAASYTRLSWTFRNKEDFKRSSFRASETLEGIFREILVKTSILNRSDSVDGQGAC